MGRFALLGVMLCCINAVSPVLEDCGTIHSLKYFFTGVTAGLDFPEFTIVGLVDDDPFEYYDSNMRKMIPKTEWIEKSGKQQYWDGQTQKARFEEQRLKYDFGTVMQHFNQTQGIHVYQRVFGCELDDETGNIDGVLSHGYNGEDFVAFDLKNIRWISPLPQGRIIAQQWNDEANLEYWKNYLTQICIAWLNNYVSYGRSALEKTVAPEVSLLQKDPSSPVVCHVTGFLPRGVLVTWQRKGEDLNDDVELGETVPNQDGTFQTTSRLTVKDWQTEDYTCTVQHKSLEKDIVKRVIEQEIRRNIKTRNPYDSGPSMGVIIGCVVGVLLALALAGIGVMVWKRTRPGYEKTNTSDTDSENSDKPAVKA